MASAHEIDGNSREHHEGDGHDHESDDHAHGGIFGERTELYFALICGVSLISGFVISKTTNLSEWVPLGMYMLAYVFGGYFAAKEAFATLRSGKFDIEILMLVAAAGAAALGAWAEGALLLFLFSIGHALEEYAMGRAKRAIEALADLAPQTALVRRGADTEEIAVSALTIGDIVVVKPNERLPADGFVIEGTSAVNQAPVTGESMPADKQPVDDITLALADLNRIAKHNLVLREP